MRKFNINDYIYIQITDSGWEHLKKTVGEQYIKYCIDSYAVQIDGETWHRLQAHCVFDILPIGMGRSLLYGTNIMIDDEALKLIKDE